MQRAEELLHIKFECGGSIVIINVCHTARFFSSFGSITPTPFTCSLQIVQDLSKFLVCTQLPIRNTIGLQYDPGEPVEVNTITTETDAFGAVPISFARRILEGVILVPGMFPSSESSVDGIEGVGCVRCDSEGQAAISHLRCCRTCDQCLPLKLPNLNDEGMNHDELGIDIGGARLHEH